MSLPCDASFDFSRYFATDVPLGGQLIIYAAAYLFQMACYQLIRQEALLIMTKCPTSFLLVKPKHNLFFRNMKGSV